MAMLKLNLPFLCIWGEIVWVAEKQVQGHGAAVVRLPSQVCCGGLLTKALWDLQVCTISLRVRPVQLQCRVGERLCHEACEAGDCGCSRPGRRLHDSCTACRSSARQ